MKKSAIVFLLATLGTVFFVTTASAQLGGLGGVGGIGGAKSNSGGDVDSQVKAFTDKSSEVQGLVYTSLKAVKSAYASSEESAKIAEEVKAFNNITDPKEKQAKVAEALKSDSAKLEEIAKANDAVDKTKKLDKEKQKQVASGVMNFIIAGLRASELGTTGAGIMQSVSTNPMSAGKVVSVKDALPILADSASTATKVFPELVKVLQGANIQVPKVTAESKTEDVKF